jgi:hydrogenase nickel incorporation protein HypB
MTSSENARRVRVATGILKANDQMAQENRRRFDEAGVLVIDVQGGPGAGKTALLEASIPRLAPDVRVGVVVGDIATTNDAERIATRGVPVVQITTESFGGACHLEAGTVRQALDDVNLEELDVLFVENVGNLVCPSHFDLGHHARAVVLSVTEGEDKPLKYPLVFQVSDVAVISKIDLVPHLNVDLEALRTNVEKANPKALRLELSSQTGDGLDAWVDWIRGRLAESRRK